MAYNGSVELISGIKRKNNGDFYLVNAPDVRVDDDTNLLEALAGKNDKLTLVFVTTDLPVQGEPDTLYMVPNASGTGYEKWWWITDENNVQKWDVFGGSSTIVVSSLAEVETPDPAADYIVFNSDDGCLMYKYFPSIQGSNKWVQICGKQIADLDSRVETLEDTVSGLGNLVTDVTAVSEGGIRVRFQDNSSKVVPTKDSTTVVGDVDKSDNGILITYSDETTKEIEISGGGGGSSGGGTARITRITDTDTQCVYGDDFTIRYSFTASDSAGDPVGSGTATWYVGNIKKATTVAAQGNNEFEIGQYLGVGTNNIKLSISVDTGGDIPTVVTKTWTINAVNMYVVWDYNDALVNTGSQFTLRWIPYGDVGAVHINIDGTEAYLTNAGRSGTVQSVTLDSYAHGSHIAYIYLTATINGTPITSQPVYHDLIFNDEISTVPVIGVSLGTDTMVQYNTLAIPVVVFDPSRLTTTAYLAVDGEPVATWTNIDRTVHYWNYTPTTAGDKVLTIVCGNTTKTINLTVTELDIDNEEVPGYAFRMKASDIIGNEALQEWSSNGVTATFSENFDWNNGGMKAEEDALGNPRQYICIKAGTSMTINYKPFPNNSSAKDNGKSFKIVFKVTNSRDYDAEFLSCYDNSNATQSHPESLIGIRLCANGGYAGSLQNTVTVQYREDSYTELEYDICAANVHPYMQTYLDGVLSGTKVYSADDDSFAQTSGNIKNIVIGSQDCDVYIYMIKMYESYLSIDNHIENFIADAPNASEMVQRYNRNDILDANRNISYERLAQQNPECRIHLWHIPRMSKNKIKKDPVDGCEYQQIYLAGEQRHQISATNVTIGVQGTSSLNYIDSAANTDGRFNDGFTDGNGNHIDGYSMTDDSIPVNYFNTKVNVASCEGINNMCLAEWYNRYQPYKTAWRKKNPKGRDTMEFHMGVQFIRDDSHGLFDDDNYHMYAIVNMGNAKSNSGVLHDTENPNEFVLDTRNNDDPEVLMIAPLSMEQLESEEYFEFRYPSKPSTAAKQAFLDFHAWFYSLNPAIPTGNQLPSPVTFGPYTFRGTGDDNDVLAGLTISSYAGTYTHDTKEYRIAKLLSECEDHLIMDSVVYHYVFIEQHCMVDNVCKNTFWGTEDLVHWHLCKDYDNDTADGNSNSGLLIIPFGSEGLDKYYTSLEEGGDEGIYVFNGNQNAYWRFIFGLPEARARMWTNRENAGAWDAEAYLDFVKQYQDCIPERVWNQDYWYKYLRPYEQNAKETYIPMLEGGKKTHQRQGFVYNNLIYMASQYNGVACIDPSNSISIRAAAPTTWAGVEPNGEIQIMLYNKGYIVVDYNFKAQPIKIKAEKGTYYTVEFEGFETATEAIISIHGANNIRAIDGIANLYAKQTDFSNGIKLRTLNVGSSATGYRNTNMTTFGIGANYLLETLNVQNCPNLVQSLNLTNCQALKELNVKGSGFTGITFANGALIEEAYLCSPVSLNMRNLYNLDDEHFTLDSYNNIQQLRIENCPGIDTLDLINSCPNLNRIRLLGIDWRLETTSLLNSLLNYSGIGENGGELEQSVLGGNVYIIGRMSTVEQYNYEHAWSNLVVTAGTVVPQFQVIFKNPDGQVLYTASYDVGSSPVYVGDTPEMEETGRCSYVFAGWKYTYYDGTERIAEIGETLPVVTIQPAEPIEIIAHYDEELKFYYVKWRSTSVIANDDNVLASLDNVPYGAQCIYNDGNPVMLIGSDRYEWVNGALTLMQTNDRTWYSMGTPVNRTNEGVGVYNLFSGWDISTGYITGNTDVVAIWESASPAEASGRNMNQLTPMQVYAVAESNSASTYFADKDYIDITLGNDFTFDGRMAERNNNNGIVPQEVLVGANGRYGTELVLDGTRAYDTGIQLFGDNETSFTMVIDYKFQGTYVQNAQNNALVSCWESWTDAQLDRDIVRGFKLGFSTRPSIYYGNGVPTPVGDYASSMHYRDICVIRHIKGENTIYVYAPVSNGTSSTATRFYPNVDRQVMSNAQARLSDASLIFGAYRDHDSGSLINPTEGTIYWCKIWYGDLGDVAARDIASWHREKIRMEADISSGNRYELSGQSGSYSHIAFTCNHELASRGYWMNSSNDNSCGWNESLMRGFLNEFQTVNIIGQGRFYHALPQVWRSMIKRVKIRASAGNKSSDIIVSNDKIYLLSWIEVGGSTSTSAIYNNEASVKYPWFVANAIRNYDANGSRIKWRGLPILDTATYVKSAYNPINTGDITLTEGDIWINFANSNIGYMYLTRSTLDKNDFTEATFTDAQGGETENPSLGGWVASAYWWTRSPIVTNTATFAYVFTIGGVYGNGASGAYGVVPCFAI